MKKTIIIKTFILVTLLTFVSFTSCKFDSNVVNNSVNGSDSNVTSDGLLVPDVIKIIKNYSGNEIPLLKVVVFNQQDVDALAVAIKTKNLPISLDLSNSEIKEIGGFSGCNTLTKLLLPNCINTISENAFKDCTELSSLNVPYYTKEIKDNAFYNCPKITSLKISELVHTLGKNIISDNKAFKFELNEVNNSWKVNSEDYPISLNYDSYMAHKDEVWTRY